MSNKAFSLVSGSCKLATRCSIFNACVVVDEDVLFELLVCCCCAACAAIIIVYESSNRLETFTLSALEFSCQKKRRVSLLKKKKSRPLLFSALCRGEECSSLFHARVVDESVFAMQRSPLGETFVKKKT